MCTVIFIPGQNNCLFASLRDESPQRQRALSPAIIRMNNGNCIAPVDPAGGGTWAGIHSAGHIIILLNGGFVNHIKQNKYSKSRGLVVTAFLDSATPITAWQEFSLEHMEPFTLIVWTENKLFQLVWDGNKKHQFALPPDVPQIWSSATLYDNDAAARRRQVFTSWLQTDPAVNRDSLLRFFRSYTDAYNGFIINRNGLVQTLSYSLLQMGEDGLATFSYRDLSSGTQQITDMQTMAAQQLHANVS